MIGRWQSGKYHSLNLGLNRNNLRISNFNFTAYGLLVIFVFYFNPIFADNAFAKDASYKQESEIYCRKDNFKRFLEAFSEDPASENKYTQYPIKYITTLVSDPEPTHEVSFISKSYANEIKLKFPNAERRKELGLNRMKTKRINERKMQVTLWKEDTGFLLVYFFKFNNCWQLTEIQDLSI